MTELQVQKALYFWLSEKGHSCITPNKVMNFGEADMISITRSDYLYEFEIKCNRPDFLNDKKKSKKHIFYSRQMGESKTARCMHIPNKFFYVCDVSIASPVEIPAHAGFIRIKMRDNGFIDFDKAVEAPLLHSGKVDARDLGDIAQSLSAKVFKRLGNVLE